MQWYVSFNLFLRRVFSCRSETSFLNSAYMLPLGITLTPFPPPPLTFTSAHPKPLMKLYKPRASTWNLNLLGLLLFFINTPVPWLTIGLKRCLSLIGKQLLLLLVLLSLTFNKGIG